MIYVHPTWEHMENELHAIRCYCTLNILRFKNDQDPVQWQEIADKGIIISRLVLFMIL